MDISSDQPLFGPGFRWGGVLSAHQVEGGDFASDWWRWEQRPGRIRGGGTSEHAAGHWGRYEEDYRLAGRLGLNTMLYALSWARVCPESPTADESALAAYAARFRAMRTAGLEPAAALHHVAVPAWFAQAGGWAHPQASAWFAAYARQVAAALAPHVRWWIPLYEPTHWLTLAYAEGRWPLERRPSWRGMAAAAAHMARAETETARMLKEQGAARVGYSVRPCLAMPENPYSPWDYRAAGRLSRWLEGGLQGNKPDAAFDFVALSYYGRQWVRFTPWKPAHRFARYVARGGRPAHAGAIAPYPEGLRRCIERAQLPVLVAGNGLGDGDDSDRCGYLARHLRVLAGAAGRHEVLGYLHRDFLDGFAWNDGYALRGGLVHVDWETQARTPNGSAYLLKAIVESGGFPRAALERYCPGMQSQTRQGV